MIQSDSSREDSFGTACLLPPEMIFFCFSLNSSQQRRQGKKWPAMQRVTVTASKGENCTACETSMRTMSLGDFLLFWLEQFHGLNRSKQIQTDPNFPTFQRFLALNRRQGTGWPWVALPTFGQLGGIRETHFDRIKSGSFGDLRVILWCRLSVNNCKILQVIEAYWNILKPFKDHSFKIGASLARFNRRLAKSLTDHLPQTNWPGRLRGRWSANSILLWEARSLCSTPHGFSLVIMGVIWVLYESYECFISHGPPLNLNDLE